MIQVNKDFEFERDSFGWRLTEWYDTKDKKTGEPKRAGRHSYYPRLEQVLTAVIDQSAGRCESIEELRALLEEATSALGLSVNAFVIDDPAAEVHVLDGGSRGD